MRLFRFSNQFKNYCNGYYFFFAETLEQATGMATVFEEKHNAQYTNESVLHNYRVHLILPSSALVTAGYCELLR